MLRIEVGRMADGKGCKILFDRMRGFKQCNQIFCVDAYLSSSTAEPWRFILELHSLAELANACHGANANTRMTRVVSLGLVVEGCKRLDDKGGMRWQ
jgi:hypothetical protein